MANGADKPSSDGKLRDSDLIGWLFGFLLFAAVVGGLFQALGGPLGSLFDGGDFGIGAVVSADGEIDVYDVPDGEVIGTQEHGEEGVITDGPEEVSGDIWWFVDFDNDPDGWVNEDGLILESAPLAVGDLIEMARTASVWSEVGGGINRGLQMAGSLGELIEGPILFNNEHWWNIDFEKDPDGWVREADITRASSGLVRAWERLIDKIFIPSLIISSLLLVIVIFLSFRIGKMLKEEEEKYQTPGLSAFIRSSEERSEHSEKWDRVQELVYSTEPAHWRLAILEADIMLADIVARMGYPGETLGDRLKQIEKSDFVTLDKAWEAHKVRNTIAHEGGDFILTQREARRVIDLYRDIFEEFHLI